MEKWESKDGHNIITLEVQEAYTRDVGRGVARIDCGTMVTLNASVGDTLAIKGKRTTVATCQQLHSNEKEGVIRMDANVRNNSGSEIGDSVEITRTHFPEEAKEITLVTLTIAGWNWDLPTDQGELLRSDLLHKIKLDFPNILANRVFGLGDNLVLESPFKADADGNSLVKATPSGFQRYGNEFRPHSNALFCFQLVETTPNVSVVQTTQKTVFKIIMLDYKDPNDKKCIKCKKVILSAPADYSDLPEFCPGCGCRIIV